MHASPNYVYARVRDSINAGQRVQMAFRSRLLLRSVIGPRIGKHTVALIRTFPSLTYLPFAFIEHIFRIVCLANLICDQPELSVTFAISLLRFPHVFVIHELCRPRKARSLVRFLRSDG